MYKHFVSSRFGLNNVARKRLSHASYPVSLIQLQVSQVAFYHYMLVIEKRRNPSNFKAGATIDLNHGTSKEPPENHTLLPTK